MNQDWTAPQGMSGECPRREVWRGKSKGPDYVVDVNCQLCPGKIDSAFFDLQRSCVGDTTFSLPEMKSQRSNAGCPERP